MNGWNWHKAYARLAGNFLISFGTPLAGAQAVISDFQDSILIAIITSSVVTMIAAGKMLDEWSKINS